MRRDLRAAETGERAGRCRKATHASAAATAIEILAFFLIALFQPRGRLTGARDEPSRVRRRRVVARIRPRLARAHQLAHRADHLNRNALFPENLHDIGGRKGRRRPSRASLRGSRAWRRAPARTAGRPRRRPCGSPRALTQAPERAPRQPPYRVGFAPPTSHRRREEAQIRREGEAAPRATGGCEEPETSPNCCAASTEGPS